MGVYIDRCISQQEHTPCVSSLKIGFQARITNPVNFEFPEVKLTKSSPSKIMERFAPRYSISVELFITAQLNEIEAEQDIFVVIQWNPGITINIRFPGKSYSKMYGAEPQFNDLRFNDTPGLTMGILFPEHKLFSGITIKSI